MSEKLVLLDQIMNYAKGHYLKSRSSWEDLQRIFRACNAPDSPESVIDVLASLAYLAIVENDDAIMEYKEQILFLFRAYKSVLDEQYINPLDDEEDIMKKMRRAVLELLIQSLLVILARQHPEEKEYQKPSSKVLSVRN